MGKIRIAELFSVVEDISRNEVNCKKLKGARTRKIREYIWIAGILLPVVLSVILFAIFYAGNYNSQLVYASLFLLLIAYIFTMLLPLIDVLSDKMWIRNMYKEPFTVIVNNAENAAYLDLGEYRRFLSFSNEELNYLKVQLLAEKDDLKRRVRLVNGSIDKIGLIPGAIALVIMLSKTPTANDAWLYSLASVSVILHLFGIGMFFLVSRLERVISLLDMAIQMKNITKPSTRCL